MELMEVQGWRLMVDRAATGAAYQRLPFHHQACGCAYCANFEAACSRMPEPWWRIFRQLGIDPRKASGEVFQLYEDESGQHHYSGLFHVCGELLDLGKVEAESMANLAISFTSEVDLVNEGFPSPMFQMNVATKVPWVLDVPAAPEPGR